MDMMRKTLYLLFLLASISVSAQTYLYFGNNKMRTAASAQELITPVRNVTQESASVSVEYNFENAQVLSLPENGTHYSLLKIKGFSSQGEVGEPSLPVYQDIIAVPCKTGLSVEILASQYTEFDNYTIYPAQEETVDGDTITPAFRKSVAAYARNSFTPTELAKIETVQDYRGVPLAFVSIRPVQYNPATGKIRCYSNIRYRINYDESEFAPCGLNNTDYAMLGNIVTNNQTVMPRIYNPVLDVNGYIIVTTDKYLPAVNYFAEWKRKTGFATTVISRASWTSSEVKQAVHNLYNNSAVKPHYLLIVGDVEDVPGEYIRTGYEPHYTDLYYVCMGGNGDYTADMARGRISVSTLNEAYGVFDKIINYQNTPPTDPEFYRKGINCAHFDAEDSPKKARSPYVRTTEEVRNYLLAPNYNIERIYNKTKDSNPLFFDNNEPVPAELLMPDFAWDGDVFDIINALDKGCFYILHRDHGAAYKWRDPGFEVDDMDLLKENNNKQPVVFSINCQTGQYNLTDSICFAEKFLRMPDKGAVGVFAATENTLSNYNDALTLGMFDAIWSTPGLTGKFNKNIIPHNDIYQMGDVLNQGLLRMSQTYFSHIYTNEVFHYFGDPSMEMYTALPSSFNNVQVIQDGTSIRVETHVDNCKITVCSKEDNGASYFMVANNVSSYTFPQVNVPCTICVTKHNYIPYFFARNTYIQNKVISNHNVYIGKNVYVGSNVTSVQAEGRVIIKEGGSLEIDASGTAILDTGFECENGGTIEIK